MQTEGVYMSRPGLSKDDRCLSKQVSTRYRTGEKFSSSNLNASSSGLHGASQRFHAKKHPEQRWSVHHSARARYNTTLDPWHTTPYHTTPSSNVSQHNTTPDPRYHASATWYRNGVLYARLGRSLEWSEPSGMYVSARLKSTTRRFWGVGWRGCCVRVALTSDGGRGDRGTGDTGTVVSPIGALMLFFVSWGCGTARWWAFGWYDGGWGWGRRGRRGWGRVHRFSVG